MRKIGNGDDALVTAMRDYILIGISFGFDTDTGDVYQDGFAPVFHPGRITMMGRDRTAILAVTDRPMPPKKTLRRSVSLEAQQ